MSNWCLGCGRETVQGDYCPRCYPMDPVAEVMRFGTEEEKKSIQAILADRRKKNASRDDSLDDIPF